MQGQRRLIDAAGALMPPVMRSNGTSGRNPKCRQAASRSSINKSSLTGFPVTTSRDLQPANLGAASLYPRRHHIDDTAQNTIGYARQGVLFLNQGRYARPGCCPHYRTADISAGSNHYIRLEIPQDLSHFPQAFDREKTFLRLRHEIRR